MDARTIYTDAYAPLYRQIYIDHPQWHAKHDHNERVLRSLLGQASSWLDVCCGQAWHFTRFPEIFERAGIDISAAQLAIARRDNPSATFFEADVRSFDFPAPRTFDLVTSFWGSYSYLDTEAEVFAFADKLVRWTAPGGSLYLELITPELLPDYNHSEFAGHTASATEVSAADPVCWSFHDPGGTHALISPRPALFLDRLAPHFAELSSAAIITTMRQVVACGRR
jgi:SAM-dependent methyltransferase